VTVPAAGVAGVSPVERYVAAHRTFAGNGAGRAPGWLRELRAGGLARFGALGFPTLREEEWRFTSVAPIAETPFVLAPVPGTRQPSPAQLAPLGPAAGHRLVFVNGRFSERLSTAADVPAGVRIESLAGAVAHHPDLVERHLGRYAGQQQGPFAALNTAFVADGAFVHVPAACELTDPVEILFVAVPGDGPEVCHPRNLIVLEHAARAVVVERYVSLADGVYWTNAVTEIFAGDGARAECYRIQQESDRAFHVATTQAVQGRDSVVRLHPLVFGAALSRHDLRVVLDGAGGSLLLNGLYLLGGRQHADHHTVIDHARPHCESHEYFTGVLDERARGVFSGRIIVRPGAQRTDSKQTNNNLLLSSEAHADSQPQLEIYADDVRCTHGSTVGPLDERALLYLRSRGIDEAEARGLLTYGFAAEVLGRVALGPLRARLDALVRARLARSGITGAP